MNKLSAALNIEAIFLKGFAYVAGGAAIGHLLLIAVAPVSARLFTPQDFGVLGLIVSYIGFFVSIGSLKYELAIVSAESDDDAKSLFIIAAVLCLLTGVIATSILFVLRDYKLFGYGEIGAIFVPLSFLGIILTSLGTIMRIALVRSKSYKVIGEVSLVRNVARAGGQIMLGLSNFGGVGLVGAEVFSRFFGMFRSWHHLRENMFPNGLKVQVSWEVARKYRKFPLLSWPASALTALGPALQIPILTSLYGVEFAGQFTLVFSVFGMAVALVGQSVGEVVHGKLADLKKDGQGAMRQLLVSVLLLLAIFIVPIVLLIGVIAPWLFTNVFGSQWLLAGRLAQWVAISTLLSIFIFPIDRMVFVNEWHEVKLVFNSVFLGTVVFVPWLASVYGYSGLSAVACTSVIIAVCYLLYVFKIISKASFPAT